MAAHYTCDKRRPIYKISPLLKENKSTQKTRYKRGNCECIATRRPPMGVDHGGGGRRGTRPPPEFGVGDANANCPRQILSYRYKRSVLWPSKYAKIRFSAGALPRTPLGELPRTPSPLVGWKGTPLPIRHPTRHRPTFGARHASPRIPAIFTPMRPPECRLLARLVVHGRFGQFCILRMHTNCYFRASHQNVDTAKRFSDPGLLEGSSNLAIRRRFHVVTLTFDPLIDLESLF